MKVNTRYLEGYSEASRCFVNVAELVRDKGGKAVFGWLVNHGGEVVQHVHHVVWETPDGELLDPTPQFDPDLTRAYGRDVASLPPAVEFLPDPAATLVAGITRPSRYVPTRRKWRRFAAAMTRSEEAVFAGDLTEANWWTRMADKERHKGHGDRWRGQRTIHPVETVTFAPLRAELTPYLAT